MGALQGHQTTRRCYLRGSTASFSCLAILALTTVFALTKATLDPTKISGRCGRLKCCLRYEYDTYEDLQKDLPPVGSDVVTKNGRARVLGQEILAQQLLVAMEDNRRILIPAGDVLSILKTGSGRRPPREEQAE